MIRIATRKSQLALWQAEYVKQQLLQQDPTLTIKLVKITTKGDKILDTTLSKIGGKGLFIKEIEQALLDNEADIAVHSLKDMPTESPEQLTIGAILAREDASDAFLSLKYSHPNELDDSCIVGTSSLRRQSQFKHKFKGSIKPLRGNVNTRCDKLKSGEFDAIILASAGLKRLNLTDNIKYFFPKEELIPAVGQGAIAVQINSSNKELVSLCNKLNNTQDANLIAIERAFNYAINGSCQIPAACHAYIQDDNLYLNAFIASVCGKDIVTEQLILPKNELCKASLGTDIANQLLNQGGKEILAKI